MHKKPFLHMQQRIKDKKVYSKDKEEMLRYEAAERAEMDFVSAISSAELRGKEIGKVEGRAEGIAKGRTEGKAESFGVKKSEKSKAGLKE